MPTCSELNDAMQTLAQLSYTISYQHTDKSEARSSRDFLESKNLLKFLNHMNPFEGNTNLRIISPGAVGHTHVNVDQARQIGLAIRKNITSKNVHKFSF